MKYLLLLLLLLPAFAFSQKLQKDVDKLNGATTYYTTQEKIYSKSGFGKAGEMLAVSVSKTNDTYLLTFIPTSGTINLTAMDSTNKTYIMLSNGKIDTLQPVNAKVLQYQPGYAYRMMLNYHLPDDLRNELKENSIAFVRIETNDRNAEFEVAEKNTNLLQKAIALLP